MPYKISPISPSIIYNNARCIALDLARELDVTVREVIHYDTVATCHSFTIANDTCSKQVIIHVDLECKTITIDMDSL